MFYVRADANSTIGSGHIMRCLAIAKALKSCGENTTFITADLEAQKVIKNNGFSILCLDSEWNNLDAELDKLQSIIRINQIEKVLVDSYYATENYLKQLRQATKIIYIDDFNNKMYETDILINYGIGANQFEYKNRYSDKTRLLIGSEYVPLRDEFLGISRKYPEQLTNILVTTGGSDAYNITEKMIRKIRENPKFESFQLHIVVGSFNINKDKLEKMKEEYHNLVFYHNISNMAELMVHCDLAITAGGTTLFELCACGVPSICFTFADNQIGGINEFAKLDLMYYVGDIREDLDLCLNEIVKRIELLHEDSTLRRELSAKLMAVVDGCGAKKIAKEILMI